MKVCDKTIVDGGRAVEFAFADGRSLVCRLADLPAAVLQQSALHGVSARVGDSFAGAAKETSPIDWAYDKACDVWQAMVGGEWSIRQSTGGVLAEALALASGKPLDACQAAVKALSEEDRKALLRKPKIKLALAELALRKARDAAELDDSSLPI